MFTTRRLFLLLLLFFVPHAFVRTGFAADVVLIANAGVKVDSISHAEARLIFTRDIHNWMGGEPIAVISLRHGEELHTAFSTDVLHLYPYQIERAIERKRYAGNVQKQTIAPSPEEMVEIVSSTPGAIGYARKHLLDGKKIKVLGVRYD
jgi:ABC-type phosphate transport system substrate-binding protein